MAPHVKEPGHPPDVNVHLVSKETGVIDVLRGSKEIVVKIVPLVSKGMNVKNVLGGSREMVARSVLLVSKAMIVNSVPGDSRVAIVYNVCRTTTELIVVITFFYFYRPQMKFAKVMHLHVSVCPQGGVPGQVPSGRYTSLRQVHRPDQCTLGDTGNKWVVRILLACILVCLFLMKLLINTKILNRNYYICRVSLHMNPSQKHSTFIFNNVPIERCLIFESQNIHLRPTLVTPVRLVTLVL